MGQVWLEKNSMLLKNAIPGIWKPPWIIEDEVEEIKRMIEMCNEMVMYIYREGNQLADHLVNYALDSRNIECHGFHQLDTQGKD